MARTFGDLILETSNTQSTGTYFLTGAVIGYRSFASTYQSGDQPYYVVRNVSDTKYECNRGGVFSAPNQLTRGVFLSSAGDGPVPWTADDLPLSVYCPRSSETDEGHVTGWLKATRNVMLRFGLWWKQDTPAAGQHQLQAFDGVNDIPVLTLDTANNYVTTAGTMGQRNIIDDLGLMTRVWTFKNDGGEQFYSSPIGPITVRAPGGTPTPVIIINGWDWFTYALRVTDGSPVYKHPSTDTLYGRSQAADVNGDGLPEIYVPSHEGHLRCYTDDFVLRWEFGSLYHREGTGTITARDSTSITDNTKNWATNSFTRNTEVEEPYQENADIVIPSIGYEGKVASTPGGSRLNISPAFTTLPAVGAAYEITPAYWSDHIFMHAGTLTNEGGTWYLYLTAFDNMLYKLNANTGALIWKYATQENIEPYPLLVDVNGDGIREIIIVSIDGFTRCFNTAGTLLWTNADTGPCDCFTNAADLNGDGAIEVIVSGRNSRVHVLNGLTGVQLSQSTYTYSWQFEAIDTSSVPILFKGVPTVLVGGDAGTIWRFDSQMNTVWNNFVLPNEINSSPVFHDVDGDGEEEMIIGDMRGTLWFVKVRTGDILGVIYHKGGIEGWPLYADIDGDGKMELVVPTTDGYVHCYRFTRGAAYVTPYLPGNARWRGYT